MTGEGGLNFKTQKKEIAKVKGSELISTRGSGSQVKSRKTEKILTKEQRVSLL